MSRFLSAAMAAIMALSPLVAEAKVLLVSYRIIDNSSPVEPIYQMGQRRQEELFTKLCDRMGVEYKMTNARGTKTLWASTGTQVWGSGAGTWTEQFDAVVHLGFGSGAGVYAAGNGGVSRCRPESLTVGGATYVTSVPQLMVMGAEGAFPAGAAEGTACSTGVGAPGTIIGRQTFLATDQTIRALDLTPTDPMVKAAVVPDGGWRSLLGAATSSIIYTAGGDFLAYGANGNINCTWCDSMYTPSATRDTVYMWERPMSHINTAKPIVFVIHSNDAFGTLDSTTFTNGRTLNPPDEQNVMLMLAGLARLDSITGGLVFSDKSKLPVKIGVTVDGGFAHNTRWHPRGSAVDDSAIVIATLDSIAAYNALKVAPAIKLTLGVNIDSVDAYPNEKAWWSRLGGNIRYSPQSWVAIADSTKGGGNASFSNPRDPLGRFRTRAAFGDTSTYQGADSTTYKLLNGSLYKTGVLFGTERVSHLLMPADDDWSPRNASNDGTRLADSTVFAIARAGFSAIRVNSGDGDCNPNYLRGNHKGFFNRQTRYTSSIRGAQINILAYHGYPLGGGIRQSNAFLDTVTTPYFGVKVHKEIWRALAPALVDGISDYEAFPYEDDYATSSPSAPTRKFYWGLDINVKDVINSKHPHHNLVRFSVNDFSGAATRPSRLAWWTLKSVANHMAMVNRLAGRTIMTFSFPEDIEP